MLNRTPSSSLSRFDLLSRLWRRELILLGALTMSAANSHGQGCVVAHGSGLPAAISEGDTAHPWDLSVSYRWFKSDRHFVGITEQTQRAAAGDQVINHSNFVDATINYTIDPRYSVSVTIPYVKHDRSQVVKDATGTIIERFSTQATGLADISAIANAWVLDPTIHTKGNVQVGLGLSLPTGDKDVVDTFEMFDRPTGKVVAARHAVDQSIQPGSGGYGIILSVFGYRQLGGGFTGFANGTYTITPQETNGVNTARSNVFEAIESIPDTYLLRVGSEYMLPGDQGLSLSLGFRMEGVMVYDLIGGSKGFRRPGYSIAIEPGVALTRSRWSTRLYVPFAIQRDRLQSVPDKQTTRTNGRYAQGDAAFADFLVMWNINYKF